MRHDAGQGRRAFILLESKSEDFHIRMPLFTCILFKGGFLDSSTEVSKRRLRAGGTRVLLRYLMTIRFRDLVRSTLSAGKVGYNIFDLFHT